jgi:hypothetical protein
MVFAYSVERSRAIVGFDNFVLLAQGKAEQAPNVRMVVNDKYVVHGEAPRKPNLFYEFFNK